jgi:hypothetical protein
MNKAMTEQDAYDFGYDNPSMPPRTQKWDHTVFVNAFVCGQADAQNHAPRNRQYQREQYDPETFERRNRRVDLEAMTELWKRYGLTVMVTLATWATFDVIAYLVVRAMR